MTISAGRDTVAPCAAIAFIAPNGSSLASGMCGRGGWAPGGAGITPPARAPGGATAPLPAAGPLFFRPRRALRSLMSLAPGLLDDWLTLASIAAVNGPWMAP